VTIVTSLYMNRAIIRPIMIQWVSVVLCQVSNVLDIQSNLYIKAIFWYLMSFFHKKNVTKFMGHHYAIWASDSNIWLTQKKNFGPAKGLPRQLVSRNDASPSDGDNKRLVCVRGDQCHDHIKDIWKRVD
jgi:hypothetical protein